MPTRDWIFEAMYLPGSGKCVLIPHPALPRSCRRSNGKPKRTYPSIDAARRSSRDPNLTPYTCPTCGQVHVGHDKFAKRSD